MQGAALPAGDYYASTFNPSGYVEALYVTERCVMRLEDDGLLATEVMPGIDPETDIVEASGGRVKVAGNASVMPVSLLGEGRMGLVL